MAANDKLLILLNWQKTISALEVPVADADGDGTKDAPTTAGIEKTVRANAFIRVRRWEAELFNMPTLTLDQVNALRNNLGKSEVDQYLKNIIDSATGQMRSTNARAGQRVKTLKAQNGFPIKIPHPTHKGVNGSPLTVGIQFPSVFSIVMVTQALGQIIKDNKPMAFQCSRSGSTYPIVYNTGTAPFTGWNSGAWVGTALIAPQNTEDTGVADVVEPEPELEF